jgi:holo-[acyl-carrier protein] synthase
MVMLAVGVDLVEVRRVEASAARYGARFYDRVFTPQEQAYCADHAARLAGRFAIKEAVGKALGTGIGDVRWVDIEIYSDERRRPLVMLHGAAADLAAELGLVVWEVSLSHTQDHAIAFVVASGGLNAGGETG